MKRLIVLAVLTITLTACNADIPVTPMSEALKISAYTYQNPPSDLAGATVSELNALDKNVVFTRLESGKEYLLQHTMYNDFVNLNFFFEYDGGYVQVISEDKSVQFSVGEKKQAWTHENKFSERQFGYDLHIANSGFISLAPLGMMCSAKVDDISVMSDSFPRYKGASGYGTEYIVTVSAGDDGCQPTITAKLRIKQIGKSNSEHPDTGYCAVELISYDYGDAYKLMESANN